MQSNDTVQPQNITIPIPARDCDFGHDRINPDTLKATNLHVIKKCDACGRSFAYQKYTNMVFRCCCQKCEVDWDKYKNIGFQRERLYYFRVKIHEKFKNGIDHLSYTPLELDVMDVLQRGPMTRDDITKGLYGTTLNTSGNISRRTTIFDAIKKLINKEKVRKYPRYSDPVGRGRPQTVFSLQRAVVTIKDFECPTCMNNKYHVDKANKVVECVFCSAEWYIDETSKKSVTTIKTVTPDQIAGVKR